MSFTETLLNQFHFPSYPLILAHDPDALLADETVLASLADRGCSVLQVERPIELYQTVNQLTYSVHHPLLIITADPLDQLPYSLWQTGHHIKLSLRDYFPHFSLPIIRALTPDQRWKLSQAPPPDRKLGSRQTRRFVLEHVFRAQPEQLREPGQLIAWLNAYHQQHDPMPDRLAEPFIDDLRSRQPAYRDWPLDSLLNSQDAFKSFVSTAWQAYVQSQTGTTVVSEPPPLYHAFTTNQDLQDAVPTLVRSGTLARIPITDLSQLDPWAQSGVRAAGTNPAPQRVDDLLAELNAILLDSSRWIQWQTIAQHWAELTSLRYATDSRLSSAQHRAIAALQSQLDTAFEAWLKSRYTALGARAIPGCHLHHVIPKMAYNWNRQNGLALIVVDGMSLANWHIMRARWQVSHPSWQWHEELLLAQIPTITAVSRQALVSGLRPMDFADTIDSNRHESRQWQSAWERQRIAANLCYYGRLNTADTTLPIELTDHRHQLICLIVNDIDDNIVHHAGLGLEDAFASLDIWLRGRAARLESAIQTLLDRDFTVYLTSDHGHTQATGIGQLSEGRLMVQSRSKRARLYDDPRQAHANKAALPATTIWQDDGILPAGTAALMPNGRGAFDREGDVAVTHGGTTIDEVIVPFVKITA